MGDSDNNDRNSTILKAPYKYTDTKRYDFYEEYDRIWEKYRKSVIKDGECKTQTNIWKMEKTFKEKAWK